MKPAEIKLVNIRGMLREKYITEDEYNTLMDCLNSVKTDTTVLIKLPRIPDDYPELKIKIDKILNENNPPVWIYFGNSTLPGLYETNSNNRDI